MSLEDFTAGGASAQPPPGFPWPHALRGLVTPLQSPPEASPPWALSGRDRHEDRAGQ